MTPTMTDTTPFPEPPAAAPTAGAADSATGTTGPTDPPAGPTAPSSGDGPHFPPPPTPPGAWAPPPGGWAPSPGRPALLRRSRTDRVGVGLCGGLGRYFGVDPVLFRVLFAVLALFGGSGVLIYLLGWAAIPDEDAVDAPLDRAVAALRRHHVPFALAAGVALILAWVVLFSWWAPHSAVPAVAVVAIVVFLAVRGRRINPGPGQPGGPSAPLGPTDLPGPTTDFGPGPYGPYRYGPSRYGPGQLPEPSPPWGVTSAPATPAEPSPQRHSELHHWFDESRARSRARRARSRPVAVSTVLVAVAALGAVALLDATRGVRLGVYFWVLGAVVLAGLLVGLAARRTPWVLAILLVPALAGLAVFGSSHASAHDGWGDRSWAPGSAAQIQSDYLLGFGRGTLDLSAITALSTPVTTHVRLGAGQLRLIVPRTLPVRVATDVHSGDVEVDGVSVDDGVNFNGTHDSGGYPAASGVALTIDVDLTAGQVTIEHTG